MDCHGIVCAMVRRTNARRHFRRTVRGVPPQRPRVDTAAHSLEIALIRVRCRSFQSNVRSASEIRRQISHIGPIRRLQGMNTRHTVIDSRLGELTLVADGDALIGVYFHRHWYRPPADTFGPRTDAADDIVLAESRTQIGEFLSGARTKFDVPTNARGDDPQRRIWDRLTAIPYGETVTYGELADELANGTTAQQVGAAVGRNPLSIVIPCHRVVGKDGKLTGYAGGLERKKFLLDLEEPAHVRAARLF